MINKNKIIFLHTSAVMSMETDDIFFSKRNAFDSGSIFCKKELRGRHWLSIESRLFNDMLIISDEASLKSLIVSWGARSICWFFVAGSNLVLLTDVKCTTSPRLDLISFIWRWISWISYNLIHIQQMKNK